MHPDWNDWLERGRSILAAPPLSRAEKSTRVLQDPKWRLGDLLLQVPEILVDSLASALGQEKPILRQYREVAAAWPVGHRVAASWTAHRELKDHPDRFSLIRPGMTMRQAAAAAGKQAFDAKSPRRMSVDERAASAIALLMDKAVNERVVAELRDRRDRRRQLRAARASGDERSAEYREAMRELREAQAAKSPERAFLEVVFQIQRSAEYVRAVLTAATDTEAASPLVPEHRKPDLIHSLEGLIDVSSDALDALKEAPEPSTSYASGNVIRGEVVDEPGRRSRQAELLERPTGLRSDQ